MRPSQSIIRRPLLTEKGTKLRETGGRSAADLEKHPEVCAKVFFEVDRDANKIEIRRAIESTFKVRVLDVRTLVRKGKTMMRRRQTGGVPRTPDLKRAFVRLAEGQVIDLF